MERNSRKVYVGTVVSVKEDKTIDTCLECTDLVKENLNCIDCTFT